jgi:hypothetical protein
VVAAVGIWWGCAVEEVDPWRCAGRLGRWSRGGCEPLPRKDAGRIWAPSRKKVGAEAIAASEEDGAGLQAARQ